MGFSDGSTVKKPPAKQETPVQSLRRSPGEENGNPLQYSCLINPMDRGAMKRGRAGSHVEAIVSRGGLYYKGEKN